MAYDRFLIAPLNTGLETDLRPWMIPDDAFAELNNAYIFRGRVKKRFGSLNTGANLLSSRLRVYIGTTTAGGTLGVAPAVTVPGAIFKVGSMISIGNDLFTVTALGLPANLLRSDGVAAVATLNTTTGAIIIQNTAINTPAYFYPAEPVMGLTTFEAGAINLHTAFAFDTQFAYQFAGGFWTQFGPTAGNRWHGTNTNFFWCCNWMGATPDVFAMFVTNSNASLGAPGANDDPLWYYNGTWNTFAPIVGPAAFTGQPLDQIIRTSRLIVNFKGHLLLLNTIESDGTNPGGLGTGFNRAYTNRCRYSHAGNPLATTAWWPPNTVVGANYATGGGYIDAPTMEDIVSAQFVKDRLIVYFERSTWEIAYTGNRVLPFVWNKLNTELGVEATFSVVPFDTVALGIGTTGIQACNGSNVERIDDKIPDKVFDIVHKSDAVKRICGIRDYKTEMVYWAAPVNSQDSSNMYPDKVLVYNYRNQSWAFNDDSFTAFGYFEQQDGRIWQDSAIPWRAANFTWRSGITRAQFRRIIAGNQQGWVLSVEPEVSTNCPALYITGIATPANTVLTIIDHNLATGDYIKIENTGLAAIDGNIYQVTYLTSSTVGIGATDFAGAYAGGGTVARVSRIDMLTKQWNPYIKQGRNFYLAKVDFCTLKTDSGAITIDYAPSSVNFSFVDEGNLTGSALGTNVLETSFYPLVPLEEFQARTWHPVYFQADGEFVQLRLYLSDDQMVNADTAESDFELEGVILYCMPTASRPS